MSDDVRDIHAAKLAALPPEGHQRVLAAAQRMRDWADGPEADGILETLYDHEIEALAMAALDLGGSHVR